MNLGKAIRLCRTQKDMSLDDLSAKAKISISYLSLLERGKRDPNFSTLESIALGLEIPVSILIFLAKKDELTSISPELADRLANVTLSLIQSPSAHEPVNLQK
jgi:transcriptional regulator with XRE-family HTH domain